MTDPADVKAGLLSTVQRVMALCTDLLDVVPSAAHSIGGDSVPRVAGVYIFRFLANEEPAYVGRAIGEEGLYQRIVTQHLRPSYRKSVFRIAIAKDTAVGTGGESVDFILQRFSLAFVECPNDSPAVIKAAEALLIAALKPKYNKD